MNNPRPTSAEQIAERLTEEQLVGNTPFGGIPDWGNCHIRAGQLRAMVAEIREHRAHATTQGWGYICDCHTKFPSYPECRSTLHVPGCKYYEGPASVQAHAATGEAEALRGSPLLDAFVDLRNLNLKLVDMSEALKAQVRELREVLGEIMETLLAKRDFVMNEALYARAKSLLESQSPAVEGGEPVASEPTADASGEAEKQYARRDIEDDSLCELYMIHLEAMTAEGLHGKADIAWELAYRDKQIDALTAQLAEAKKLAGEAEALQAENRADERAKSLLESQSPAVKAENIYYDASDDPCEVNCQYQNQETHIASLQKDSAQLAEAKKLAVESDCEWKAASAAWPPSNSKMLRSKAKLEELHKLLLSTPSPEKPTHTKGEAEFEKWWPSDNPGKPRRLTCDKEKYREGWQASRAHAQQQIDALTKFKSYVHKRLDDAGVPTHPNGPHSKEGCRIGDRLDIVLRGRELDRSIRTQWVKNVIDVNLNSDMRLKVSSDDLAGFIIKEIIAPPAVGFEMWDRLNKLQADSAQLAEAKKLAGEASDAIRKRKQILDQWDDGGSGALIHGGAELFALYHSKCDQIVNLLSTPSPEKPTHLNTPSNRSEVKQADGYLEVGITAEGLVVLNHPQIHQDESGGHIIFSSAQARDLAWLLLKKSTEAEYEQEAKLKKGK